MAEVGETVHFLDWRNGDKCIAGIISDVTDRGGVEEVKIHTFRNDYGGHVKMIGGLPYDATLTKPTRPGESTWHYPSDHTV